MKGNFAPVQTPMESGPTAASIVEAFRLPPDVRRTNVTAVSVDARNERLDQADAMFESPYVSFFDRRDDSTTAAGGSGDESGAVAEPSSAPEAKGATFSHSANFPPIRVAVRRAIPRPVPRVRTLEHWEGTVVSIEGEDFVARLRSQTDRDRQEQVATFSVEDLDEDDRALVALGAVFYWHIGYRVEPHGTSFNFSDVRFRRLPAWTSRDLAAISSRAAELDEFFGNKPSDDSSR